jgi:hypothetical protein
MKDVLTEDVRTSIGNAQVFPLSLGDNFNSFGLSKRELFAAMAMQGIAAGDVTGTVMNVAADAVALADALLKELAK